MRIRKIVPLLASLLPLAVSSCSFFPVSSLINGDGSKEKQTLLYHQSDLSTHSRTGVIDTPAVGNPKFLIIPIWFTDSDSFINTTLMNKIKNDINSMAFGDYSTTNWHSIKSFYGAESHGLCNIEGTVTDWYQCGRSYRTITKTEYVYDLVNAAVNNWKTNNPSQVQDFDSNNDGIIDAVICVYGCPNYSKLPSSEQSTYQDALWAFTTSCSNNPNIASPNVQPFIWASYDFMYNSDTSLQIDAHTFIHETGHLFGLEDYYDYNDVGLWSGGFSMQDYNVGGHDPYSIMTLGWANPYVATETCSVALYPFESSGDLLLISPDYSGSPFDEYLLFELYSPTGVNEYDVNNQYRFGNKDYPRGPNTYGIRVWHVDSRLIYKSGLSYFQTTAIVDGHTYSIGPKNTTKINTRPNNNAHATDVAEFENYHLLELIKKGDYNHTSEYYRSQLTSSMLFKQGDVFKTSEYSSYFVNSTLYGAARFNNGKTVNWTITFEYVNSTGAILNVSM